MDTTAPVEQKVTVTVINPLDDSEVQVELFVHTNLSIASDGIKRLMVSAMGGVEI